MSRSVPVLVLTALLSTACATARHAPPPPDIDPTTDPTIIGTIDEAVVEASAEVEHAARVGRGVGTVIGLFAAVLGGPEVEDLDDSIDRFFFVRDLSEATAVLIAGTHGAVEGAQRGFGFDEQFAELDRIEGIEAVRPLPDRIDVTFLRDPDEDLLAVVAAVFAGREARAIEIEAPGDTSLDIRESLISLGLPSSSLSTLRNDAASGITLHIGYRE